MNSQDTNREDWLLWQFADSALPTGGFVASAGLESATQAGHVTNAESLLLFLSSSIENYAYSSLPFVTDTWWAVEAESSDDENLNCKENDFMSVIDKIMEKIINLDDLYNAYTSNYVTKRASKTQGVAMLTLFTKSFADNNSKTKMKDTNNQFNYDEFHEKRNHSL
ncbi:6823_t:CDS:1, partial [Gigaspora rosea]